MKFLALYLRAPLQSWGASSHFGSRGTLDAPTRSGILGLLAAACGIDKNDADRDRAWLARAATLSLSVLAFRRGDRMADFHTVGGGFDEANPWQKRMVPVSADGKNRRTNVTRRDYLADSVFGAILSGDDALLDETAAALANPVWGIWLGRKSCVPTEPVLAGLHDSAEAAKTALSARFRRSLERADGLAGDTLAFVVEETRPAAAEETVLDIPVSFSRREYHARPVRRSAPEDGT